MASRCAQISRETSTSLALELMPWYLRKPVVASVQGHALGGGCELAMFCDLTIAADDAMFGEPESRFSQTGTGFVMPWIIGFKKARELLYLGDMIDARTALDLGMVNRIVPREELAAQTAKLAKRIALVAPETLAATKLAINRGADAAGFRNAMQAGIDVIAPLYAAKTEVGTEFRERAAQGRIGSGAEMAQGAVRDLILRRSNYLTMIVTAVNRCPPLGPTRSIVLPRTLTVTLASLGPQSRPCRRTISTPDGAARAAPHVTTLRSLADAAAQHIIVIRQATVNARIGSPSLAAFLRRPLEQDHSGRLNCSKAQPRPQEATRYDDEIAAARRRARGDLGIVCRRDRSGCSIPSDHAGGAVSCRRLERHDRTYPGGGNARVAQPIRHHRERERSIRQYRCRPSGSRRV